MKVLGTKFMKFCFFIRKLKSLWRKSHEKLRKWLTKLNKLAKLSDFEFWPNLSERCKESLTAFDINTVDQFLNKQSRALFAKTLACNNKKCRKICHSKTLVCANLSISLTFTNPRSRVESEYPFQISIQKQVWRLSRFFVFSFFFHFFSLRYLVGSAFCPIATTWKKLFYFFRFFCCL